MMTDDDNNKQDEETPPTESPELVAEQAAAAGGDATTTTTSPVSVKKKEDGGFESDIGKFHFEVNAKQVPLVGYFFASFIFMISAVSQKSGLRWYGYAVSIGVVGMFSALIGLLLLKFKSEWDQTLLAYFNIIWAFIGACMMTFGNGPFRFTGNGYFSVWAMVIFAAQHAGVSHEAVKKEVAGASSTTGLALVSIIVIAAIAYELGGDDNGEAIYALVLSCLTIVFIGTIMYMERYATKGLEPHYQFYILIIFSIMWIVAACLVTFVGPFTYTGNGYFASWAAAVLSVFAALSARQQIKQSESAV